MIANHPLHPVVTTTAFKREVRKWARRIEVHPGEIHLRRLSSKQASCSPKGRLTFSTTLLSSPTPARTEAIVHELIHLKVPNHGKLFKVLLKATLEKYD